jgi:hypothetical protein
MTTRKRTRRRPFAGIKTHRTPNHDDLDRIYSELMARPNVYGCFVGRKIKKGKSTSTLAITCLVSKKKKVAKSKSVPEQVTWSERGRERHLSSDVAQVAPKFVPQAGAVAGPGDSVMFAGNGATAGVVLNHPEFGRTLTTAAHLFALGTPAGAQVIARSGVTNFQAVLRRRVDGERFDYALLGLADPQNADNLYLDRFRVGPIFIPTAPEDLNRQLFILTPQATGLSVRCRGINARIGLPGGSLVGVILTDAVTVDGHSGACLVDEKRRVWGFLRGRLGNSFSVFMPASALLLQEHATLI